MSVKTVIPYTLYKQRREVLRHLVFTKELFDEAGWIIIGGDFEVSRHLFRQESSLYYYTGLQEPGMVLVLGSDGREILYIPNYGGRREQWVNTAVKADSAHAERFLYDEIKFLGASAQGYSISPLFNRSDYETFIADLQTFYATQSSLLFMVLDGASGRHITQMRHITQLRYYHFITSFLNAGAQRIKDCAGVVHEMRRTKDSYELDSHYKAVQITEQAHKACAGIIAAGKRENEIQAVIESVFTILGSTMPAFPSIVATGYNTTVLHYMDRDQELQAGELVVVDIGADYAYYAADLTRTYPVNGIFSARQREIYSIVLEAQSYIESLAAPGMFLRNAAVPEKSLQHLVVAFLEKTGYGKYFTHGIGHFLGIDVHDVGDVLLPLRAGDVITIEPGIYIPKEALGVRIEDDYVIVDDGCVCLSENLGKSIEDIEALMAAHKEK